MAETLLQTGDHPSWHQRERPKWERHPYV